MSFWITIALVANYFVLVCMTSLPRPAPSLMPPVGGCLVRVSLGSALPDTVSARLTSPPGAFKVSGALPATMMLMAAFKSRSIDKPHTSHW